MTQPDSASPVTKIGDWLNSREVVGRPISDVRLLGGGTQNQMFMFRYGRERLVARLPPVKPRPTSNKALLREMRVLAALEQTSVKVPHIVAGCDDPAVLDGAVFYVMSVVDGFNCMVELPERHAHSAVLRHEMGMSAAAAAASLRCVNYVDIDLADLGSPEGFLQRQVPRWLAELNSYGAFENYPGPELPGLDLTCEWLRQNMPTTWKPGLMHGDFHLGNLMFEPSGAGVAAIVDWEMVTIGDPLVDLGWLLATWPTTEPLSAFTRGSAIGDAGGLPTRSELIRHYGDLTGCDTSTLPWYQTLACFKLGILLEGTYARSCAGKAPGDVGDRLHRRAVFLFEQARTLR